MAAVQQPTTGQLEGWIRAQVIEIIAVLIVAADHKNPGAKGTIERMRYLLLIALLGNQPGKENGNSLSSGTAGMVGLVIVEELISTTNSYDIS